MIRTYDPRDVVRANAQKRSYRTILATNEHERIQSLRQLHSVYSACMGLFCNDVYIGYGYLEKQEGNPKWLHTDSTNLGDKFRKQGHGLQLYLGLIRRARRLGATRLYSGRRLNKLSNRMWNEKLAKLFDVCEVGKCAHPCRHCKKERKHIYYINL
jgi:hypothetical protein